MATNTSEVELACSGSLATPTQPVSETITSRMLVSPAKASPPADASGRGGSSSSCFPFLGPSRVPFAVRPGSSRWVEGERLEQCPLCEVQFGTQHKHVTKRHCRKCGGVFCYTCTYDKAQLRTWPSGLCLPLGSSKANVRVFRPRRSSR